ncbi:lipopolysaccharide biosynthesis protein [Lactococcus lactis]|uniref:lipopolysaccharide biosynthesis protein n=1 Tax=Lactococcus lactis TaxID=1358 RepID=UPI00129D3286|nr:polysaccharide biosynthesis C-terminal domain-containing protein [Lactococcus lactis]
MKKLFHKLAGDTLIFAIGNGATLLISFFMVPIYTRILSTSAFGVSDLINTTVNMLLPVVSLNIFNAVFRWALDIENNKNEVFSNGSVLTGIGFIISVISGTIIYFLGIQYWWTVGFYLGIILTLNHFQNFARGMNFVRLYAMSGVVISIVNVISNVILMIIYNFGLNGYLLSLGISNFCGVIFLFFSGKFWRFWDKNLVSKSIIKEMLAYSMPMIPNSFTWWMTNDISRLIILAFVGPSGNGLFAIANKIPSLLSTGFTLFQNAWQISAVETSKYRSVSKIYSITFNITLNLLLLGSGVMLSIIKLFMHYYVSSSFFKAWEFVPILLLTAVFSNVSAFLGTTYLVAKKTKGLFTTTVWGTIINLGLSFALIPVLGVHGAGISGAVGFLVVSILRLKQTAKWINIRIKWGTTSLMMLGYASLASIVYLNDNLIFVKVIILVLMIAVLSIYLKSVKNISNSIY